MMHRVATSPRAWMPRNQSRSQKKRMTTGSTILSPNNIWLNPRPRRLLLSIPKRVPILSQSSRWGSVVRSSTVHAQELGLLLESRCLTPLGCEKTPTCTVGTAIAIKPATKACNNTIPNSTNRKKHKVRSSPSSSVVPTGVYRRLITQSWFLSVSLTPGRWSCRTPWLR